MREYGTLCLLVCNVLGIYTEIQEDKPIYSTKILTSPIVRLLVKGKQYKNKNETNLVEGIIEHFNSPY